MDCCKTFTKVCYTLEGDSFLAPITYETWNEAMDISRNYLTDNPKSPLLKEALMLKFPGPENLILRTNKFESLIQKVIPGCQMCIDHSNSSRGKLRIQLRFFFFARLWNYVFIAREPIDSIRGLLLDHIEIAIPFLNGKVESLLGELHAYKYRAEQAVTAHTEANPDSHISPDDMWNFWIANKLVLPVWCECSAYFGTVTSSSGVVERVFSRFDSLFDDHQESSLADYKEGSALLAFNNAQRNKNS
jgi:hypothetical protein